MCDISILMATYNGGKFIAEQIESLINQTLTEWKLFINDDGSDDDTIRIVNSYQKKDPRIQLLPSTAHNLGARDNFAHLMQTTKAGYIMFCDQDDVWLPEKVQLTFELMQKCEGDYGPQTPLLVHTDCRVVGLQQQTLAPSFSQYQRMKHVEENPLRILLTQNFVTGCTVMINRALLNIALPVPREAVMHDWWLALVAASAGRIRFLEQPTVLYRQHQQNVAGAKKLLSGLNFKRLLNPIKLEEELKTLMIQDCALARHLSNIPHLNTPRLLGDYLDAAGRNGFAALRCAVKYRIAKQGIFRNILYYLLLLRGSYTSAVRACYI